MSELWGRNSRFPSTTSSFIQQLILVVTTQEVSRLCDKDGAMCFDVLYRVVEHSERPLAFAIGWLSRRVLGEFSTEECCFHICCIR